MLRILGFMQWERFFEMRVYFSLEFEENCRKTACFFLDKVI